MKKNLLKPAICLAAVLLVVISLRLPLTIIPFFNVDEGTHAVSAEVILDGGIIYRDALLTHGPLTPYVYALIFLFSGRGNMEAVHFFLMVMVFATATVIYFTGALAGDRATGCWAALLFSVFSYTYEGADMLALHAEWPVIFFTALAVYFSLKYAFTGKRFFLLLSGSLLGVSFFFKQPAIFVYPVTLAFLAAFEHARRAGARAFIRSAAVLSAGFFLVCAATTAYFYLHGAIRDFWFCFWEANSRYYISVVPLSERLSGVFFGPLEKGSFLRTNGLLTVCFLAACFLAIRGLFSRIRDPREAVPATASVNLYLIGWGIFSYLGAAYSGRQFGHYFILVLPAFCIVSAQLIRQLLASPAIRPAIKASLAAAVALGIAFPLRQYGWDMQMWKLYLSKDRAQVDFISPGLRSVADYLKNNSAESDKIFVWGLSPEIYILAKRMPASRHIWCNILTDLIPGARQAGSVSLSDSTVPQYWRAFLDEIGKNRPKFIVDTSPGGYGGYGDYPPHKFREFSGFLDRGYLMKKEFFLYGKPALRVYERIS